MRSAITPLLRQKSKAKIKIKNKILENFIENFKHARLIEACDGNFENILKFLKIDEIKIRKFILIWKEFGEKNELASKRQIG